MVSQKDMANAIRILAVDAISKAKSGHPGIVLGMADVATVLFTKFLKFNPNHPEWQDRDRFVMSSGHGSMLLYSLLYLSGYSEPSLEDIKDFRQLGSKTPGHPEYWRPAGVEASTGPLGQGLGMSVGMALAERILEARFGSDIVSHYTYVLCGDGCLMEGISEEAISLAGHLKLNKLIAFWDDNDITIDGSTELSTSTDQRARFLAHGWNVLSVDGHNHQEIEDAIRTAQNSDKPTLIACKTAIGYGSPNFQGSSKCHGSPFPPEEIPLIRERLGWPYEEAFFVPEDVLQQWRKSWLRNEEAYDVWQKNLEAKEPALKAEYVRTVIEKKLPADWKDAVQKMKENRLAVTDAMATRKSSQAVLSELVPAIPELLGGSADLSESNGVMVKNSHVPVTKDDYAGNFIHYGIREHGMAACMNGLVLHGGFIPFASSFLSFVDYMLPSIRLASLMKIGPIYVFSHDSFAVGEDGPSHQPVEQLALLRFIPNVKVFRPADAVETAECWQYILENRNEGPMALILTRQNVDAIRTEVSENLAAKGAYVISPAKGERAATIIASGSEVAIAVKTQKLLAEEGVDVAVVAVPCRELFEEQAEEYQNEVLGSAPRIVVEAALLSGWDKYIGTDGASWGMKGFGTSAPYQKLFDYFKFTPEHIAGLVKSCLNKN
ncbi:MAG: transketolase [Alphaproteobacteria bacterium]|nr:transketolase [Alphaproteobacteria bacterium]